MALPPNSMRPPGMPSTPSYAKRSEQGDYIRTNRDNLGSWTSYLEALRRVPGSGPQGASYETPEDRASGSPGLRAPGGKPTRPYGSAQPSRSAMSATSAIPAGRYDAAQETPAGTPEANYAAGLRTYGAGGRSAPNVGAVRNKGGYNERDRRVAARNSRASLATGDEMSRVRLLGG